MRFLLILALSFSCLPALAQDDSLDIEALRRMTVLSEVVVRSDLNTTRLLKKIKDDTTFYKAFRNLRVLQFTSLNDIKMLDKKSKIKASLFSKTRQRRTEGCRTMEVLEERSTGDMYRKGRLNYFTAELYAGLFFTDGKVCGENNTVAGVERNVRSKSGLEKHKEQLKMMFFNPGKKIPGIPFIGDKINIFDPDIARNYNLSIDLEDLNGLPCYVFKIAAKQDLSSWDKNNIVFNNIITYFNEKTMEIVFRSYDMSYKTPVYDFDVRMEVEMGRFKNYLVPQVLRYTGDWKILFRDRERGVFTATLSDFSE